MQTVRDDEGRVYLLLKRSSDSSKVRDPGTGEERYLPNDDLAHVSGESPLEAGARAVPDPVRTVVGAAGNDRALGLLVELAARGPLSARQLLDDYDMCESDLHGTLVEFRLAGLVEEADVFGERGYELTDEAREAVAFLTGRQPTRR